MLVAAVVECPVLCFFGLHFDDVSGVALGLGYGIGFCFLTRGCCVITGIGSVVVRFEALDVGVVTGFALQMLVLQVGVKDE